MKEPFYTFSGKMKDLKKDINDQKLFDSITDEVIVSDAEVEETLELASISEWKIKFSDKYMKLTEEEKNEVEQEKFSETDNYLSNIEDDEMPSDKYMEEKVIW